MTLLTNFKDFLMTIRNTCKPDMRCALVAKPTYAGLTRESTGNEKREFPERYALLT